MSYWEPARHCSPWGRGGGVIIGGLAGGGAGTTGRWERRRRAAAGAAGSAEPVAAMLLFCPGCGNGLIVEEGPRCHRFACNTCPYVHNVTRKVGARGAEADALARRPRDPGLPRLLSRLDRRPLGPAGRPVALRPPRAAPGACVGLLRPGRSSPLYPCHSSLVLLPGGLFKIAASFSTSPFS